MSSDLHFDHAIILVKDLEQASADFREVGFNVFYGGQHSDGKTHNALIVFQDTTYLELLAPTDPAMLDNLDTANPNGFLPMFEKGEGFGGYALLAKDLGAEVRAMQGRGLDVRMRPAGGRARPDGQELRWQSAVIEGTMTPFFIQDDTPRPLRVPNTPETTRQPNGVIGVKGISTAAFNMIEGIGLYRAILDEEPSHESFTTADFALNGITIEAITPASEETDNSVAQYLIERGTAPYMLTLRTSQPDKAGYLDLSRTHGALIELMAE
jgi:hypothetical protein